MKSFKNFNKKLESTEIDPTVWNRLVWQKALDQALKKQRDKEPIKTVKIQ